MAANDTKEPINIDGISNFVDSIKESILGMGTKGNEVYINIKQTLKDNLSPEEMSNKLNRVGKKLSKDPVMKALGELCINVGKMVQALFGTKEDRTKAWIDLKDSSNKLKTEMGKSVNNIGSAINKSANDLGGKINKSAKKLKKKAGKAVTKAGNKIKDLLKKGGMQSHKKAAKESKETGPRAK